jgi:hypothetical protein
MKSHPTKIGLAFATQPEVVRAHFLDVNNPGEYAAWTKAKLRFEYVPAAK